MSDGFPEKLPLADRCVERMLEDGLTFGWSKPAEWFAGILKEKVGSNPFAFAMMAVKTTVEDDHGLYLASEENGASWRVLQADETLDVLESRQRQAARKLKRAALLGDATLGNPGAVLSDRKRLEGLTEKAAFKYILLHRAEAIRKIVQQHAPKLLAGPGIRRDTPPP